MNEGPVWSRGTGTIWGLLRWELVLRIAAECFMAPNPPMWVWVDEWGVGRIVRTEKNGIVINTSCRN
jgi:hypothetical protein